MGKRPSGGTGRSWTPALIGMALLSAGCSRDSGADLPAAAGPIRLPLTFVDSNPVTTITVAGRPVPAVVDISGGDADGALTLSKELIEAAKGVNLGTAIATDASGHEFTRPRFSIPAVTIDGRTFRDLRAVQEMPAAAEDELQVSNQIGKPFLSRYFVVVDYAGASITLWPPDTRDPAGVDCGGIHIPMAPTREDRLAVSLFDTAAGPVRLLWGANPYSMLPESIVARLRLPTTTRGPGSPGFHQAATLTAAGQELGPLEFVVLPLDLPADFEGMLGRNFFDHHVVCLDYQRREIRVR